MKDLIAALAVLVDPNASPDDKAAAADKLTAYFNAQLDAEESKQEPEAASEMAPDSEKAEGDSGASEGDKDESSKEMASALSAAMTTIATLTDRVSKIEKASAVGNRPRASKPTVIQRTAPAAIDPHAAVTISMIERAAKNTIGMLGK